MASLSIRWIPQQANVDWTAERAEGTSVQVAKATLNDIALPFPWSALHGYGARGPCIWPSGLTWTRDLGKEPWSDRGGTGRIDTNAVPSKGSACRWRWVSCPMNHLSVTRD